MKAGILHLLFTVNGVLPLLLVLPAAAAAAPAYLHHQRHRKLVAAHPDAPLVEDTFFVLLDPVAVQAVQPKVETLLQGWHDDDRVKLVHLFDDHDLKGFTITLARGMSIDPILDDSDVLEAHQACKNPLTR